MVSNAGIASASPVEDTSLALWQKNIDVLATGYFLVAREAFRLMQRQQCGGAIVFVASKNGLAASAGASAYCAAKASEIHLARCLALEGAPHGIRVVSIHPTGVNTPMNEGLAALEGKTPQQIAEASAGNLLPVPWIEPEDVANGVLYLASNKARFITGSQFVIDAGLLTR